MSSDRDRRRLVEVLENHELTVRLRLADAVVEAAKDVYQAFDNDLFDTTDIVVETVLLRLFDALAALDAYLEQPHDTAENAQKAATGRERDDS